ncbi:DUF2207 domain-containing protein [Streptomyces sp. V3I7]|uniref:DUF2207 family protein n=1 Tax=Streptomyces sp. V3I7 TaxID=3042278 RepID=UPI0027D801CD|nr:DUF2207 domain-containing protein [Streptomyces sp. V3I7]
MTADVKRRRRRNVVAVLVTAVVLAGAAMLSAYETSSESVARMWAAAELSADGRARITEVIDYDFGHEDRHGIFRDVPGLPGDADEAKVHIAMDGEPVPYELQAEMGDNGETRILIGDADRTVTGAHRYRIQYQLDDIAPKGKLAWNAVGTGWLVPLEHVEIHVTGPHTFADVRCVSGRQGSRSPCQARQPSPGHLTLGFDHLDAGRGATLYAASAGGAATVPPSPAEPSGPVLSIQRPGPLRVGLLAGAIALAAGLLTGWALRLGGRERVPADVLPGAAADVTPADAIAADATGATRRVDVTRLGGLVTETSSPPEGLTPAQGGVLLTEKVLPRHQVAWLLKAVIDGYVVMDDNESFPTLTRPSRDEVPRTDREVREVLDQAFAGRDSLHLGGGYDRLFSTAWRKIASDLERWRDDGDDLWEPGRGALEGRLQTIGLLGTPVGLIATIVAGVAAGRPHGYWAILLPVGAALAGAGVALFAWSGELMARTPKGSALWLRLESFRRYLAGAGAQHVEEAAGAGVLDHYTAWAVALGAADRWSEAVKQSTVPPPAPSPQRPARVPLYRTLMAYAMLKAVSSTTTPPPPPPSSSSTSSSNSSSSSDYSVGGGGGGGGGGSW